MFTAGTRISATATGRRPWKILCTIAFSLNAVKNIAISSIITNDGSTAPMVAAILPFIPRIL